MYYVYVLRCSDGTLYIGYSTDLKNRLEYHKNKMVLSTKNRLPVKIIYYESFSDQKDAKAREVYLKSGSGRKQIKSILKNTLLK